MSFMGGDMANTPAISKICDAIYSAIPAPVEKPPIIILSHLFLSIT